MSLPSVELDPLDFVRSESSVEDFLVNYGTLLAVLFVLPAIYFWLRPPRAVPDPNVRLRFAHSICNIDFSFPLV